MRRYQGINKALFSGVIWCGKAAWPELKRTPWRICSCAWFKWGHGEWVNQSQYKHAETDIRVQRWGCEDLSTYTLHFQQQRNSLLPWRWCYQGEEFQPQSAGPWCDPFLRYQSHPWHAGVRQKKSWLREREGREIQRVTTIQNVFLRISKIWTHSPMIILGQSNCLNDLHHTY